MVGRRRPAGLMHHVEREQRRFRRLIVAVAVLVLLIGAPLLLAPAWRLTVGQRLQIVPGQKAERLFGPGAPVELVVLIEEVPVPGSLPSKRYTAVAIAEREVDGIRLHDLAAGKVLRLPISNYDRIAASSDRTALLFVANASTARERRVLVTLGSGEVRELSPDAGDPSLPGNWSAEIPLGAIGCGGVSPRSTWVACIRTGTGFSPFLFGGWELQAHRYGDPDERVRLYRGRGTHPIVGWAGDESALYFQNEFGVWRVAMPAGRAAGAST